MGAILWGTPPPKIVLDHADTLRSRDGSRELIGHVKVSRAGTVINAERALYAPDVGRITLTGAVRMKDPDRRVAAQQVAYDERSGDFQAEGEVDMTFRDSIRVRCRSAHYREAIKTAELFDDVVIDILRDSSRITGSYGLFRTADSSGVVEGGTVYRLPDREGVPPDTLVITSEKLRFNRRDQSAFFTGDVRLTKGELLAVADTLFHFPDSNLTRLAGAPLIWHGSDELAGRTVEMVYEGRDLKRIEVEGEAVALSPARDRDPRRNRLAGRRLTLQMTDDSSRVVHAMGNAEGWYFVWDEKKGYQGVNIAAADTIRLVIVGKRTTDIKLQGKTSGAFYPPGSEPPEVEQDSPPKRDGIGWGEL